MELLQLAVRLVVGIARGWAGTNHLGPTKLVVVFLKLAVGVAIRLVVRIAKGVAGTNQLGLMKLAMVKVKLVVGAKEVIPL